MLQRLGAETRTFNPSGLPLPDDAEADHPKIQELRDLVTWREGMVWCSPERHGAMTGIMKAQIDWIPLSIGAIRPTQGKTLAVKQVCGGSQSFNAINQLRVFGALDALPDHPQPIFCSEGVSGIRGRRPHGRCDGRTGQIYNAHPSLTGLSTGTGSSGSTAWSNSVRSRQYLSRINDNGFEADPDRRVLTTKKANYGRIGAETHLQWQAGVFVAEGSEQGLDKLAAEAKAQHVFVKLLSEFTAQCRRVNHAGGSTYAPKLFAEHPASEGMTKRAMKAAVEGLLAAG